MTKPTRRTVSYTHLDVYKRQNLFRTDDLSGQLAGRLENLLDAAAQPGMSWLIDPALLDEVRDMADGYQVVDGSGTAPGTGAEVAAAWLLAFAKLDFHAGGRTLYALSLIHI